ncbi:MAG: AI-2E family transporter, partial [Sphaerochaetaceae bacterium]
RLRVPHVLGIVVCFLLVVLIVGLAWWVVYKTVSMLVSMIPAYVDRVGVLDKLLARKFSAYLKGGEGQSFLMQLPFRWKDMLVGGVTTLSSQLISAIKVCVLVILYVLFMLMEKRLFLVKMLHAFSESNRTMVAMLGQRIPHQVSSYLSLKAVVGLLTGLMYYLTAMIVGMEVPMLYGVLAFVFNFIPSIGSIFMFLLTVGMGLMQFAPHWEPVILVAAMSLSIEVIVGNVIDPKLHGGQLNLSPVVILVSLSIWGYIWGVVGMFIAVPLTSCLQIICANIKSLRPIAILLSSGKSYQKKGGSTHGRGRRKRNEDVRQQRDAIFPDVYEDEKS